MLSSLVGESTGFLPSSPGPLTFPKGCPTAGGRIHSSWKSRNERRRSPSSSPPFATLDFEQYLIRTDPRCEGVISEDRVNKKETNCPQIARHQRRESNLEVDLRDRCSHEVTFICFRGTASLQSRKEHIRARSFSQNSR